MFARELNVDLLLSHVRAAPDGAVAALLANWVVPGQRPHREGRLGLRFAIRNGYANFYAEGQSVAKLTLSSKSITLETHRKYHLGVVKDKQEALEEGSAYCTFSGDRLHALTEADVLRWTRIARHYASAEKCFVERLVAQNPNIIDLEAGLPGRTAPRIDLAVTEMVNGRPTIGFWEAKCINNTGLSATTPHDASNRRQGPKVFTQVLQYQDWLSENIPAVAAAYQRSASIMVALADGLIAINEERFGHLHKLDDSIRALASALPEVNVRPGLVVGTKCPSGWLDRQPDESKTAHLQDFADSLRRYRAANPSHEAHVRAFFGSSYVPSDEMTLYRLPQLVG